MWQGRWGRRRGEVGAMSACTVYSPESLGVFAVCVGSDRLGGLGSCCSRVPWSWTGLFNSCNQYGDVFVEAITHVPTLLQAPYKFFSGQGCEFLFFGMLCMRAQVRIPLVDVFATVALAL